ncbi:MAG: PASTA domain-containing protein [Acutalibacteraceae bacterium]|nr:PASTA domain-containing protein [Acutalibacteraceae bacterium]
MISSDNLCMSCMREIGEKKQCPHCGYHADSVQIPPYLPVRTVISNRYLVGKMLEYNGEGATYIGWDLTEKKAVKIREFIPESFTTRTSSNLTLQVMRTSHNTFVELRQSFVELWTKLARLKGLSALISVTDVVNDYGTSYAIYEHFEGISLRDFLLRSKTGYVSWDKARQLLMPILSTLGTLHSSGIIHRGISPSTLIIGPDGKVKITGFCVGAARTSRSELNSQLFDGYAAIEQYGFDGGQGTWTDIYAFAAVLYRTLIGSDPISAKERMANDKLMVPGKFAEALPAYVINGLINALQILPDDRTRTVEQLRAELSASPAASAASGQYQRPAPRPAVPTVNAPKKPEQPANRAPAKAPKKKNGVLAFILSALSTFMVGAVIFAIVFAVNWDKSIFANGGKNSGTSITTETGELVEVPNFTDRLYLDVSANPVFTKNFKFVDEYVYSSDVEDGYIVDQSIKAGEKVPAGTTITLSVSKGVKQVVLPNVVGSNYEEAKLRLEELGFVCQITERSDPAHADKEVLSMSPAAEQSYEEGRTIYLVVNVIEETVPATDENGEIIGNDPFADPFEEIF